MTNDEIKTGDKVQRAYAVGPAYSIGIVKHVMQGKALVSFEGTWPVWILATELAHYTEA
jgi:hypothetical protein